jgi:hypothetical protein
MTDSPKPSEEAKYSAMRDAGASPHEIFRQVLADGLGDIAGIRMLRLVFGLELRQCKEVMIQTRGWANSIDEHEERIADEVEEMFKQRKNQPD